MAHYSNGFEEGLKRAIRDELALDPIVGDYALTARLGRRLNHSFDPRYVKKVRDKVLRQERMEADRTKIEERLNFSRQNYRMMRERLLKIIYWEPDPGSPLPIHFQKPPYDEDVIQACKSLVEMDLALLKAEIANGMYKDESAAAAGAGLQYAPLSADKRELVVATFMRWGALPAEQVQTIVGPVRQPEDGDPPRTNN